MATHPSSACPPQDPFRPRSIRYSLLHAHGQPLTVSTLPLLTPRRPTARCPLTRTVHTSLATPPASGSMRATSSPHCSSVSHPTGHILPFTHRKITPYRHKRNAFHSSA